MSLIQESFHMIWVIQSHLRLPGIENNVFPLYLPCMEAAVVGKTFLYLAGRYWAAFITNWRAFRYRLMQVLLMQMTSMTIRAKMKTITPGLYCHVTGGTGGGNKGTKTDRQGHSPWTRGRQTPHLPGGLNLPAGRQQSRRGEWQKSSWSRDSSPCPRQPPYWVQRARKYQKSIFYVNLMNYENYFQLLLNKELLRYNNIQLVIELIKTRWDYKTNPKRKKKDLPPPTITTARHSTLSLYSLPLLPHLPPQTKTIFDLMHQDRRWYKDLLQWCIFKYPQLDHGCITVPLLA